jgi:hypothetical protein
MLDANVSVDYEVYLNWLQDPCHIVAPLNSNIYMPSKAAFEVGMEKALMFPNPSAAILPCMDHEFVAPAIQEFWRKTANSIAEGMQKEQADAGVPCNTPAPTDNLNDVPSVEHEMDQDLLQLPAPGLLPDGSEGLYDAPPVNGPENEPPYHLGDAGPTTNFNAPSTPGKVSNSFIDSMDRFYTALDGEDSFAFTDMTKGMNRFGAACSFYDLLMLASQSKLNVQQNEPYSEIIVSAGEKFHS